MSELQIQSWTMPAVDLGAENPLPPLAITQNSPSLIYPPDTPAEMLENMAYGHLSSMLPYSVQDGFDRQLAPVEFRVAVLENEILRATFLIEYGGRLWSLIHKPSGRELLEVNPVFQLANLAIRKAWFSGGVEWNIGKIGHSPLTCSPLFACRLEGSGGTPILRLYEWERFRQTPFQIDAYLPDGSPVLFIRVRISNPNNKDVPMYWWSNIAIPETSRTRVIVPAESAFCLGCKPGHLEKIPVPEFKGIDFTYSARVPQAADFYFDIPEGQYPWIAALDGKGKGLVQVSTKQMRGRKLWVWGTGTGGRNWQRFLSPPGQGYIEIQAGLTRTQLEYQRMPAGEEWSWLEAYGLLEADPGIVHGSDWQRVWQHVNREVIDLISFSALTEEHQCGSGFADTPPVEYFQLGSGWGALERRRREAFADPPIPSQEQIFGDDTLMDDQSPWLILLQEGSFPERDSKLPPSGYIVGAKWGEILENALDKKSEGNWLAWYHAGLIRYHAGNQNGALRAWKRSLELAWTPWTARNLAVLAWQEGKVADAADLLVEACCAAPGVLPLAVECGRCLIEAGRHREWLKMVGDFPSSMRSNGRIRLLEAQAALAEGELERASEFFEEEIVIADLREGENSLTDLWFNYQALRLSIEENLSIEDDLINRIRKQVSIPTKIDFRMKTGIDNTDI
jgi:hypothetical protein